MTWYEMIMTGMLFSVGIILAPFVLIILFYIFALLFAGLVYLISFLFDAICKRGIL